MALGILKFFGKAAVGAGKLALDQTKLTEKGRKKIAQKENADLRKLRLKEARRKEYEND